MSTGPPPGEAGPSNCASVSSTSQSNARLPKNNTVSPNPISGQIYTGSFQTHTSASPYYESSVHPADHLLQNGAQSYHSYNYPQTWNGNWPSGYSYPHSGTFHYAPQPPVPVSPPSPYHKHWDEAIKGFLVSAGLTQALRGFEADMVVMNENHEQKVVPPALNKLKEDIEVGRMNSFIFDSS